eukprot:CAMPEP_0170864672 /NCGR_PEP_ID=MMETSP0734-20130129/20664_1 /TAXON_ID=186038 /ORGANISM="Fragilariopsis kerguelensis, Strain L26-C5" /LENGTH=30 /DNA_ID= /DNA_START= /DNA_END= /DNA_ORIENTATION=
MTILMTITTRLQEGTDINEWWDQDLIDHMN